MASQGLIGLIGALAVLTIMLLALWFIVRRLMQAGAGSTDSKASDRTVFGPGMSVLLTFAVVYKFIFDGYTKGLYSFQVGLVLAIALLVGLAILPAFESLVSLMALVVFVVYQVADQGTSSVGLLAVLLLLFVLLRWVVRR